MADRMYHSLTGWHEEDEKHTATHMILTVDEYENLCNERNQAIRDRNRMVTEVERYKETAEVQAKNAIKKAQEDANRKVEIAEAAKEAAKEEAKRQENLNRNLLRITRERANSKRGLQPKKEHHGYRFSGKIMQTKTISGHDKKKGAIYTDVWTATLESPYDGTIPIHQIQDKIFDDLKGTDGILSKLYIKYWTYKDSSFIWKGTYAEAMEDNENKENYLFDYKFMINPKSGLWEIQITTTKSIRALSEMMNPPNDKKKNGGNSGQKKVPYVDDSDLFGW